MLSKNDSLLTRPLTWLTRAVTCYPRVTVGVALAIALVGMALAVFQLGMRSNRLDLISRESRYNQRWINYINEFGDRDDVVIVVEGHQPSEVVAAVDTLTARLQSQTTDFDAILSSIDPTPLRAKALYYLDDQQLVGVRRFANETLPIAQGKWGQMDVRQTFDALGATIAHHQRRGIAGSEQTAAQLTRTTQATLAALEDSPRYVSPWPAMPENLASGKVEKRYLLANEGRVGLILLRLKDDDNGLAKNSEAIDRLRQTLASARPELPKVSVGLTGLPVLENDEMRLSERATMRAGLLSLAGVACLFIAGFGGLRYPLMTVAALLVALAWTMGYITLAVGHLNILSMSFGVILIGLGIDFGIHYIARYLQVRRELPTQEALEATATSVGPGVLVGAVTTSAAFFTAGFTEFTGVAELGIIAGGGILLCTIAAVAVLPALIRLAEGKDSQRTPPEPIAVDRWVHCLLRRPRTTLVCGLIATSVLAIGVPKVWFDHNLLNLQADGLESVRWEQKLINESDQSVWYAVSLADSREELLERKQAFQRLASVERVEEIASWLPAAQPQKTEAVRELSRRLMTLPDHPDHIPVASAAQLQQAVSRCETVIESMGTQDRLATLLRRLRERIAVLGPRDYFQRISWLQQNTAEDLLSRLKLLAGATAPTPPSVNDLPHGLVARFVGNSGRHLIKVYGRGNIWDMESLEHFVEDVRRIDPEATGKPLQTYEASHQMQRSYIQAAAYALVAVVIVLLIDFRDPRLVLLAALPLVLGTLQMFGLLGFLGIPLNPANLIVLPLILGIGIDDGVHVVHDFRRQKGSGYRLSKSTAAAVMMTTLTTIVGFGSLMIASHRGLESLGRVLTLGVTCCLFSSLVILPALLAWLSGGRPARDRVETPAERTPSSYDAHLRRRLENDHESSDEAIPISAGISDRLIEPRRRDETTRARAA